MISIFPWKILYIKGDILFYFFWGGIWTIYSIFKGLGVKTASRIFRGGGQSYLRILGRRVRVLQIEKPPFRCCQYMKSEVGKISVPLDIPECGVDHKLHESYYLCEDNLHTQYLSFTLESLWWVVGIKTWILVLSFKPKLNNSFRNSRKLRNQ